MILLNCAAIFLELFSVSIYFNLYDVLTAAGMKHLRDNGVVHRDIKPGNIMRYITDDGRYNAIAFL